MSPVGNLDGEWQYASRRPVIVPATGFLDDGRRTAII
jgi:hypothetical protein